MALEDRYRNLPFTEASEYLRGKISLGTDKWDDILDAEHDAAFVIAGAKGSLLSDLRAATERAISNGQRPEEFLKDFERIAEGWAHTGDKAWRSNIILQTNLDQSYAAGRLAYQLDPEVMRVQPYLQWIHSNAGRPRPSHLALDRKVFRADQLPFYPPNGYGCKCRTISLTQRQLERQGLAVETYQRGDLIPYTDERGNVREAVLQPDKGFDRIPGRGDRRALLEGMIARMPASVAAPLRAELARIDAEMTKRRKLAGKATATSTQEATGQVARPGIHDELLAKGEETAGASQLRALDKALQPSAKLRKMQDELKAIDVEFDRLFDEDPGLAFKSPIGQQRSKLASAIQAEQAKAEAKAIKAMGDVRSRLLETGLSADDAAAMAAKVKINKIDEKSPSSIRWG